MDIIQPPAELTTLARCVRLGFHIGVIIAAAYIPAAIIYNVVKLLTLLLDKWTRPRSQ